MRNAHELQNIFRELPDGPFTVHVAERTPIGIAHADFDMLSPSGGLLTVWDIEGQLHHIDASSITRITQGAPAGQLHA
jgi:hypothetical protein